MFVEKVKVKDHVQMGIISKRKDNDEEAEQVGAERDSNDNEEREEG